MRQLGARLGVLLAVAIPAMNRPKLLCLGCTSIRRTSNPSLDNLRRKADRRGCAAATKRCRRVGPINFPAGNRILNYAPKMGCSVRLLVRAMVRMDNGFDALGDLLGTSLIFVRRLAGLAGVRSDRNQQGCQLVAGSLPPPRAPSKNDLLAACNTQVPTLKDFWSR